MLCICYVLVDVCMCVCVHMTLCVCNYSVYSSVICYACVHVCVYVCVCTTKGALCVADVYLFVVNCVDCCVALVLVLSTLVSHSIPQLCSSLFLTTPHLLYLQEQRQRATTFTKRLRNVFNNLERIFLRGRVLKQASREILSPGSTKLRHQGMQGK